MLTRFRRGLAFTAVCCMTLLYFICLTDDCWKQKHKSVLPHANQDLEEAKDIKNYPDSNSVYMTKQKKNTRGKNSRRKPKKHTYLQPDFSKLDTFLLFIGYPRSGSTLIGSLLDAHPNIIIANEHNVITRWKNFTREQQTKEHVCTELYNNSVKESLKEQRAVFKKYFFHYHVPGLWQGRFDGQIKVIGDKKSTSTSRSLSNKRSNERFLAMKDVLNVPVKFIHLIRNPFDNIATMVLRAAHSGLRMKAVESGLQLNTPTVLHKQMKTYLSLVDTNAKLRNRFGENVLDVHYSSFIRQPKIWLKTICDFLEVHCSEYYLDRSVSIIFKNETYTRRHIVWSDDVKQKILDKIKSTDFLNGLKFEIS